MKDSRLRFVEHRWPLIEMGFNRKDCLAWCKEHGFPKPPKSACTFCPYHDGAMWREMKTNDPESFAEAVMLDEAIRPGMPGPKRPEGEKWYVHRSLKPLAEVDFSTAEERGQGNLFMNECEGMCGV